MAYELKQFGIGLKIVEPGGMKTDFFTRSFDTGRHQAYDKPVDKVMSVITDPKQMETYSSPAQIAEVVYDRNRRERSASLCCWRRCKSNLCNATAGGRRSVPQGYGATILWP